MRFRSKLFLAILLPSAFLVAIALALSLRAIRRESREGVDESFKAAGASAVRILSEIRAQLSREELLRSVRVRGIIKAAYDSKDFDPLRKHVDAELAGLQSGLDYVALVRGDDEQWYRFPAGRAEPKKEVAWLAERQESVLDVSGRTVLARAQPFEEEGGFLVLGRDVGAKLSDLRELKVELGLRSGSEWLYRSRDPWPEGDASWLTSRIPVEGLGEIVLLRSLADAEARRRQAVLAGLAGLAAALAVAAAVSALIARGTSKPVELLVEATKRVAAGDYATTSGVGGKDELGRLGEAFDAMTEGLRKRRDIMEKTLSRDVAEELMKGTELGGERREVTIVFMDIRGFTSGTQGVDPADVVAMLNDMMEGLAAVIDRHGGNVNKYLGDGLMAMFGAPKPLEDHALRAAKAAVAMQAELAAWNARRTERGLPAFHTGIGINTGVVVCGRVGSKDRLEYTLIGEEVNLASRICGKAEPKQVLVTEATARRAGDGLRTRALEPVSVKGISYPVKVYEVLG